MANNPTLYSPQYLLNFAADHTVDPPIPRAGILVRDSGGAYRTLSGRVVGSAVPVDVSIVDGSGNQITSFGGSGGTSSSFGSAIPSSGTAAGFSDGTNMQLGRVYDTDSGAGTEYTQGAQIRVAASGGSVGITGDASNGLDVDVTRLPSLVAGSAIIGKVSIDQTTPGTTNLVALAANQSVNIAQMNGVATTMGNGVSGTGVQRVTIASDSTGQVALAAGTNGIGKLTSNSGVTIGAVEIAASQTLSTVTTVSTVTNQSQEGGVAISLNAGAVDTGTRRVVQANGAGKTILSKSGSASTSGNNTLVSAGTNKLKVFAFSLSTSSTTAVTCKFQDGAGGTDLWSVILQAPTSVSTGANLAVSPPAWLFNTSSATLLNLNLSSANAVQWSVSYFDEA